MRADLWSFGIDSSARDRSSLAAFAEACARIAEKPCLDGDFEACMTLAYEYLNGSERPQDNGRGAAMFEKACQGWYASGCSSAARLYQNGHGMAKEEARAAKLYEQGCDLGESWSCYEFANALNEGRGVLADQARATQYFIKACETPANGAEAAACAGAGERVLEGIGAQKDAIRAKQLYEQACVFADLHGCDMVVYLQDRSTGQGAKRGLACGPASPYLGPHEPLVFRARLYSEGKKVPKDAAKAMLLLEDGCTIGEGSGCLSLGSILAEGRAVPKDAARAAAFHKKARAAFERRCKCDEVFACHNLGVMYSKGLGGPKKAREGAILVKKTCESEANTGSGYGAFHFSDCPESSGPK